MVYTADVYPTTFSVLYCPFADCPEERPFPNHMVCIEHLKKCHNLQVENVEPVIPLLDRYLRALAARRQTDETLQIVGSLGDTEDKELRKQLQLERLQNILNLQHHERQTVFKTPGQCLFCAEAFLDKHTLFTHMYRQHGFNIGQLDNLVMVQDFLSILKGLLDKNKCIYCERDFPDGPTMRKHMKTKGHFKINSHNPTYDRFYIINYMLPGTTWEDLPEDSPLDNSTDDDDDVDSDDDDVVDTSTVCLLCEHRAPNPELINEHMKTEHNLNLASLYNDFYDGVKVINFVRVCWRDCRCAFCGDLFDGNEELTNHFKQCQRKQDGKLVEEWREPQYLFPFYEDDNLLSFIGEDITPATA